MKYRMGLLLSRTVVIAVSVVLSMAASTLNGTGVASATVNTPNPAPVDLGLTSVVDTSITAGGNHFIVESTIQDPADPLLFALRADPNITEATRYTDNALTVTTTYTRGQLIKMSGSPVYDNFVVTAASTDPLVPDQWYLENPGTTAGYTLDADIDMSAVWGKSNLGTGIVVAVIDSGIDFSHPELAGAQWTNPGEICGNGIDDDANGYIDDCVGWDFAGYPSNNTPWDGNNSAHGTEVAGVIAAADNGAGTVGVAPNVKIMDVRILNTNGSALIATAEAGIRYATASGADIISMSIASPPGLSTISYQGVAASIVDAQAAGILVVFAAGNDNTDISAPGKTVIPAVYGSRYTNALTVGSTHWDDTRAVWSNYGSSVAIAAPGSHILTTGLNNTNVYVDGTSFSTPMVSAALAVVLSDQPTLTPPQAIAVIESNADVIPALNGLFAGSLRLNLGNVYGAATTPTTTTTAAPTTTTAAPTTTTAAPTTTTAAPTTTTAAPTTTTAAPSSPPPASPPAASPAPAPAPTPAPAPAPTPAPATTTTTTTPAPAPLVRRIVGPNQRTLTNADPLCPQAAVTTFGDIINTSYAYRDVQCIYGLGITTGTGASTYAPASTVTREQMAAFIARLWKADGNACATTATGFVDVPETSFAYNDIACIYALGITNGTSPGLYSPAAPVTREQMASFLARLWKAEGNVCAATDAGFVDMPETSFAKNAVNCIYALGITNGTSPGHYSPAAPVTREQMASFIARLYRRATTVARAVNIR